MVLRLFQLSRSMVSAPLCLLTFELNKIKEKNVYFHRLLKMIDKNYLRLKKKGNNKVKLHVEPSQIGYLLIILFFFLIKNLKRKI